MSDSECEFIEKKTKISGRGINVFNGLTKKSAFKLEKDCLDLLNKNYECICEKKSRHFPIIHNYDDINYTFNLSYCGKTIKELNSCATTKSERNKYRHPNLKSQLDCIMFNLQKNKIKHLDMHKGKNLCINKKGVLSLIDFDIAVIDDKFLSEKIEKRANYYINYEKYKKCLLWFIENGKGGSYDNTSYI
jgi:hypothetical protein